MIKDKVFISFSWADKKLMDRLRKALDKSERVSSLVITTTERANTQLYNTEKVAKGIIESKYFVPVLTSNSYQNQWVNQEIGYAAAKAKPIYPIIENQLLYDKLLKGWIHTERDLPYRFDTFEYNEKKSRKSFREQGYKPLIECLEKESEYIVFDDLPEVDKEEIRKGKVVIRRDMNQAILQIGHDCYPLANVEIYNKLKDFIRQSKDHSIDFSNIHEVTFKRVIK
ncbi:MAG: toll/interleukin-1 receptor domain-containing protein [Owenweeksia sp.]